jgi:hypothetical protein
MTTALLFVGACWLSAVLGFSAASLLSVARDVNRAIAESKRAMKRFQAESRDRP